MIEYNYPGGSTRFYPGTYTPITLVQRFLPTDVSGVVLWLDGKDSGTVVRDGSNNVSQWTDKSIYGNHAIQNAGVNQPTYNATTGQLSFDGSTTFLLVASNPSHNITGPLSIFCVASDSAGAAGGLRLALAKANHGAGYAAGSFNRAGRFSTLGIQDYTTADATFWGATKSLATYLFDSSYDCTFYKNNQANALVAGASPPNSSAANLCIGAHLGDGTFHWQGALQEIILFNRLLTVNESSRLNTYAIAKWGIT